MRKKGFRKLAMLLTVVMLAQSVAMPVEAMEVEIFEEAVVEDLLQETESVSVTTQEEFMSALSQKKSNIIINGIITIGKEADSSGKMYPVEIPGGTTIQGSTGTTLNCRCPIQLTGDNVTIKDLNITFDSSDALGSVPHREIFLAGYSLTLDNVDTYLAGNGGSLGELGSSEEELLPSVYAGGFENTTVGTNAQLTIVNGNSKTMFKGIYMGHDAEEDNKVAYEGTATVKISPQVIIREGIYTSNNASAEVLISGGGNVSDLIVYGNENTRLQVEQTNLYGAILDKVGTLVLKDEAYLELQQGELGNVTLQENACLDLNKVTKCIVNGDFTGGIYNLEEETDTRGVLVVNEEGCVDIKGTVENTTFFHTDNRNFPGEYVPNKQYIYAPSLKEGSTGFILPDSKAEAYIFSYEEGGWTVCERYDSELVIGSIDIISAPAAVDISKIWGLDYIPAKQAPYCQVYWKDEKGNVLSASAVEYYKLFYYDYIIPVKTSYWDGEGNLEAEDWKNEYVEFAISEDNPNCYYFYAGEDTSVEKGEYTFLFFSEPVNGLSTVEDVKALKEKVKGEMKVYFYDSTEEKDSQATDIGSEEIQMGVIEDQTYTGKMLTPDVKLTKNQEELIEGQDYVVTYENSVQVGTDTGKAIVVGIGNYCGIREMSFSITKGTPKLTFLADGNTTLETEYESEICLSFQITPFTLDMTKGYIDFYSNDTLLGTSVIGNNGQATLYYDTTERKLPAGESVIIGKFGGNEQLNSGEAEVTVRLQKKSISIENIASVSLKNFVEDGETKTTEIVSVTTTEGITYPATGVGELSSGKSGTYGSVKINSWTLQGEKEKWYQLPSAPDSIKVSPEVLILEKPSATVVPSITVSPSVTVPPSPTVVLSPTVTPSVTISPSPTVAPSVTISPSITKEPSITVSPSTTPSTTPEPSTTAIPSITPVPTTTVAPSITVSPSVTLKPSATVEPSVTLKPSGTVEPSVTLKPSTTIVPSTTMVPSITVNPSVTLMPSTTVTPNTTVIPSTTPVPSITLKPSATVVPDISKKPSTTPNTTVVPSTTVSPSTTPIHTHTWNSGIVTQKPMAFQKGQKTYTCTACGETKTEILPALKAPKKGTVLKDKKAKYKVTKSGKKGGTVQYVKPLKTNVKTVTIPDKVKIDGIEYKVTSIAPKAFYNYKKLKYVTIGKNVIKIGTKAFCGCKSLKKITIKTTKLTQKNIGKSGFAKVNKKVTVKVPAKKFKTYQKILKAKGISKKAIFRK